MKNVKKVKGKSDMIKVISPGLNKVQEPGLKSMMIQEELNAYGCNCSCGSAKCG